MTREEIQKALNEKLDRDFEAYKREMLSKDAEIIFECADEIHATQQVYEELYNSTHYTGYLKDLLRYQNPLEVMRGFWQDHNNVSIRDDFAHALWCMNSRDEHKLDEDFIQSQQEQQM